MFALLMCNGNIKEKAGVFFDTIIGQEGKRNNVETISWRQSRLVTGFKKLIFFSEIFPKKFFNDFANELLLLNNISSSHRSSKFNSDQVEPTPYCGSSRRNKSGATPMSKQESILWTDEYLILVEENFNDIIKEIYEEKFVDFIFLTHESLV